MQNHLTIKYEDNIKITGQKSINFSLIRIPAPLIKRLGWRLVVETILKMLSPSSYKHHSKAEVQTQVNITLFLTKMYYLSHHLL